ncbi:RNA polymerase sigma factor [Pseudoduganella namucuonensis]|uniref:RNA polymerase sigma-70 factor, ECF subfamily n=1 Tax=Pseudoduganella namucuonensis TaxID=1035707 RepID=A0A1I7KBE8_9BURK|nr:RNA polymerase sigma factor [Pseudoduganella namucuonensis]SFU94741.1 RNA polymerase sigma-70 factor, ECF subfamily [Pseudoduganella namucuonensis]
MQDDGNSLVACIPRLRRYARALLGDRASADDLVQDTMERGWRKLSSWHRDSDMRPWLFGIMHNLHVDRLRQPSLQTEELGAEPQQSTPHTDRLEIRDMQAALQQLPAEQREVLLLVALEEMTYQEVAAVLQIPPGTVMSRLSRARERLRLLMLGQAPVTTLKVVK